ncbi:DUF6124 family protein [Pseudomonas sp. H9]|uniref:DUF6124 family protein n=1 Tax=Pseudomonas sp. H9 TaxID=483968 RepID=UPI0010583092|nr:hypothetical protein [Pseudomonas sp. H9]TDF85115.1 hypothetical protein E1573_05590 [Pseudomonas sp. H9]
MKKHVPDPPSLDLSTLTTASRDFGESRMFNVRAGISGEEALLYACHLLQNAEATVKAATDNLELADRALVAGIGQPIEAARALIEGVIDGAGVPRLFSYC